MRRVSSVACLLVLLLALIPVGGSADEEASNKLDEVEQAIAAAQAERAVLGEEARIVAAELDQLRERLLAAETAMRRQEQNLLEIADTLAVLTEEMAARRLAFDLRRDEFALVLAALQRIARQPAEMLLAMPTSPTDTHRTAMLLAALTPELDRRADEIATEIAALLAVQGEIAAGQADRAYALETLAAERAISAAATIRKREILAGLYRQDTDLAAEQERLAAEAGSLRELIEALAMRGDIVATRPGEALVDALAASSFGAAKGNLALPVAGTIATQFGETIDGEANSEGIVVLTAPGARVTTPYDGQVVYAGPFRDYGHLLIIDHGEGYHTVLAGLARADVVLGQWLLAGEPIGAMSVDDAARTRLYVELRRGGVPINPLSWTTAGVNEVTGG